MYRALVILSDGVEVAEISRPDAVHPFGYNAFQQGHYIRLGRLEKGTPLMMEDIHDLLFSPREPWAFLEKPVTLHRLLAAYFHELPGSLRSDILQRYCLRMNKLEKGK